MRALERKVVHMYLRDRTDVRHAQRGRRARPPPRRHTGGGVLRLTVSRETAAALAAAHGLREPAGDQISALLDALAAEPDPPTTVRGPAEALDRHIADSLSGLALQEVRRAQRIADIGAGAGFPGLALAACPARGPRRSRRGDPAQVRRRSTASRRPRASTNATARCGARGGVGRRRRRGGLRSRHRAGPGAAGGPGRVRRPSAGRGRRAGGLEGRAGTARRMPQGLAPPGSWASSRARSWPSPPLRAPSTATSTSTRRSRRLRTASRAAPAWPASARSADRRTGRFPQRAEDSAVRGRTKTVRTRIWPHLPLRFRSRWAPFSRSPTRRAASARRRLPSTSPPASPTRATTRCSSTSTRSATRQSGWGCRRTQPRARTTASRVS